MTEKTLFEIKHIMLKEVQKGVLCIEVDDHELWDYVQDYLWYNFQITEEYIEFPTVGQNTSHRSYYVADITANKLIKALSQLNPEEVERIYKLNN